IQERSTASKPSPLKPLCRSAPAGPCGHTTPDRPQGEAIMATIAPVTGRHLIDGHWLPTDGRHFERHNPARPDEAVGVFPTASPEQADQAVAVARAAFPAWRRTSRIYRAELFDTLAQLVKRDAADLARLMARECGKVVNECKAEVIEGLHMILYVFGTGRMPVGDILASEIPEKDVYMRRKPWGVVAVI